MASMEFKNNSKSTVADSPLATGATTLNVAAGEGANFPSTFPFLLTIWHRGAYPNPGDDSGMEIVRCTSRTTDALTIVRAQEGTADVEHTFGEHVAMLITAGHFDDSSYGIVTKLDTIETNAKDDQTGSEIVTLINAGADLIDDDNIASTIARDSEVSAYFDTSTGHDHDGTDSKKVVGGNVTNTPAGNIVATDVQGAITELDSQDTTHAALTTGTHGVTGAVVGTSDTQTLSNKTFSDQLNAATGRCATLTVAANDSSALSKGQADYVCDGTDDQVPIQAAIDALPANGGSVLLLEGNYEKNSSVGISISSNTQIELLPGATIKLKDGINVDSYIFINSDFTNGNENIVIKGGKLDCNSQGQSSGIYRAINFENVIVSIVDSWIENHNHLEYKMKNCKVDFTNRILMRPTFLINECSSLDGFNIGGGTHALSSDRMSGTKSIQLTSGVGTVLTEYYVPSSAIDFRYRQLRMWIKFDDINNLETFRCTLYNDVSTPIYASMVWTHPEKVLSSNTWYPLLISFTSLNIDNLNMTLNDYKSIIRISIVITPKAGVSVVTNIDKIELVSIPTKPVVSITFDDGIDSQLNALPILGKYNNRAMIAVILNYIGTGGYLTLAQLRILKMAGWDLVAHTMSHPYMTAIEDSKQDQELIQSKVLLNRRSLGSGADFFVVPYHDSDGDVIKKIKNVYTNYRTVYASGGATPEAHIALDVYSERPQWSCNIDDYTAWTENDVLRHALVFHDWIQIYGHAVDADMETTLESLALYCYEQGIEIKTFSEIYNKDVERTTLTNVSVSDLLMDVLAVSATHVRSNEDLSAATPITFTLDAQPDIPRTLSWSFDTHAQITEYDMEVVGIDAKGNIITETWDETAGWSGETSNAFATITSIKMTSRTGTGVADTMDIGITDVLGLSNIIYETSDVFKIKKNNANATVATAQVNTTYDTYDMSVIGLGAGDDFTVWYKSNLNIIS